MCHGIPARFRLSFLLSYSRFKCARGPAVRTWRGTASPGKRQFHDRFRPNSYVVSNDFSFVTLRQLSAAIGSQRHLTAPKLTSKFRARLPSPIMNQHHLLLITPIPKIILIFSWCFSQNLFPMAEDRSFHEPAAFAQGSCASSVFGAAVSKARQRVRQVAAVQNCS